MVILRTVLCSMCRRHDMRMALNYYEVVNEDYPEYETVQQLLRTISLSDPDRATITLVPSTEDWSVNFIRHKKRETYRLDENYLVTITAIREYQLKKTPQHQRLDITPDCYNEEHNEMEVHTYVWLN